MDISACCRVRYEYDQDTGEPYCKNCFKVCKILFNQPAPKEKQVVIGKKVITTRAQALVILRHQVNRLGPSSLRMPTCRNLMSVFNITANTNTNSNSGIRFS
jgi:hypothetical protein